MRPISIARGACTLQGDTCRQILQISCSRILAHPLNPAFARPVASCALRRISLSPRSGPLVANVHQRASDGAVHQQSPPSRRADPQPEQSHIHLNNALPKVRRLPEAQFQEQGVDMMMHTAATNQQVSGATVQSLADVPQIWQLPKTGSVLSAVALITGTCPQLPGNEISLSICKPARCCAT